MQEGVSGVEWRKEQARISQLLTKAVNGPPTVTQQPQNQEAVKDALTLLIKEIRRKGPSPVKNMTGQILNASLKTRAVAGKNEKLLLAFITQFPQIFIVSEPNNTVSVQLETAGELSLAVLTATQPEGDLCVEALQLLVKAIKTRGVLPVKQFLGTIHNARKEIRLTAGTNDKKLESFCSQYPDILQIAEETNELSIKQ